MRRVLFNKVLSNFSISQKMILIFIGCVILPLFVQNMFYYSTTEKNIQNQIMQRLTQALSEKANKIDGCISGAISLSFRYSMNEELYRFLDTDYSDSLNYFTGYQSYIKNLLLPDLAYDRQISQLILYSDNPTILNGALVKRLESWNFDTLGENLVDYSLNDLTQSPNGPKLRVALIPSKPEISSDRSLNIIRPMNYYKKYSKYQKVIRVDINLSYISSMINETSLFDNIILVDSDNRILASANTYREAGEYDIFSEDKLKRGIVVLKQPLSNVPLSLYGYYDTSIISKEFVKMRLKIITVTVSSILMAFFCIFIVASNITRRTKLVVNLSESIAKGNFIQISNNKMGSDEIGILAESINQMSLQLQTLINEKYNARLVKAHLDRETAQAKLLALQSQVNPHFMFNVLECIRLKATAKNETETARIIMYVSKMFRYLINWDDDIITLSDEIKFLEEFLYVQKYRFEDEFEYSVEIDDAARTCLLPKLIIQPIVENACVHGIESISQNKKIEILIKVIDTQISISVSDNGMGIDEPRLSEIKNMLEGGQKLIDSVGLYNVYQRLYLYYGNNFSIDVQSKKGIGTKFNITIPIRYSKEEF
ncbi:MAG: two-component system, sensor histidine kinase YesM [Clostridiales bacterium]|nr:two-component system, sensor histidine kinase YesM [Clostridiales bacterium]